MLPRFIEVFQEPPYPSSLDPVFQFYCFLTTVVKVGVNQLPRPPAPGGPMMPQVMEIHSPPKVIRMTAIIAAVGFRLQDIDIYRIYLVPHICLYQKIDFVPINQISRRDLPDGESCGGGHCSGKDLEIYNSVLVVMR